MIHCAQSRRGSWLRRGVLAMTALAAHVGFGGFVTTPVAAQEGHPLKGSWLGTWKNNEALGNDLILILDWDGKAITGMINPGTDNIPITKASLEPKGWVVTLEADAKDKSGARAALSHRGPHREPRAPESLDRRNLAQPARPRRVRGEPPMSGARRSTATGTVGQHAECPSRDTPEDHPWGSCPHIPVRTRSREGHSACWHTSVVRVASIVLLTSLSHAALAHHEITAKFDETKPATLSGIVTAVDWRNPHVHVFVNVDGRRRSGRELGRSSSRARSRSRRAAGAPTRCARAIAMTVEGIVARDGTRQIWGETRHAERDGPPRSLCRPTRRRSPPQSPRPVAALARRPAAARRDRHRERLLGAIRRARRCGRTARTSR